MGINFPNSPTLNQVYPVPAQPGVPVYRWNGSAWVVTASPIDQAGTVRYDVAQSLSSSQIIQARQNIYTPPFDAMAYSGIQYNGNMEVTSDVARAAGVTVPNNTAPYICDGWQVYSNGPQAMGGQTLLGGSPGYPAYLQAYVATGNASPAAGTFAVITHYIEGYRSVRLAWGTVNAQPITIAFWCNAHRPGMYSGALRNADATRSYAFSFTINAADTWEYKTVTIPGDVTGTWKTDNAVGIIFDIALMAGTTYQTAPGAWTAGNFIGATGTINGVAVASSDVFYLTGVMILPGTETPSAARAPFIMRAYPDESEQCQRYYQILGAVAMSSYGAAGSNMYSPLSWLKPMRAAPTVALTGPSYSNASGVTLWSATTTTVTVFATIAAAGAAVMTLTGIYGNARF